MDKVMENSKMNRKRAVKSNSKDTKDGFGKNFIENVLCIRRVAKVIKGGRRLVFSAFVVVGDGDGKVGVALGKGREVAGAVSKAFKRAKKNMVVVPIEDTTVPFDVEEKYGASKVLIKPATRGTGVIAGGAVRMIMGAAGVKNVLSKTFGSSHSINVAYAVMGALKKLQHLSKIRQLRNGIISGNNL